jgi:hypothetical protein
MADDDTDDTDEHDGSDHGHSASADPVLIALQLCALANNKTVATAIKKLCRLDRQFADTQAKIAALTTEAERMEAKLAQRAAELAEREHALDMRETGFESSLADARDELREHHARLDETHRQLIHRIMSCSGILAEWNPNLQPLPTWEQLRRMIVDLPADLPAPAADRTEVMDVKEDWTGHVFVPGSTLTRSINKAAS